MQFAIRRRCGGAMMPRTPPQVGLPSSTKLKSRRSKVPFEIEVKMEKLRGAPRGGALLRPRETWERFRGPLVPPVRA